jgi:Major Facilitator Superfamily
VATLIGQVALGQLGDHLGRKPIIAFGFLLNSTLPLGLTIFRQFSLLAPLALLTGLGSACIAPMLGASYLDITAPQHRSVIQGIRESAISLSAVAGPLLATFISHWLAPQAIFTVAAVIQLSAVIPALVVLKLQRQAKAPALGRLDPGRRADTSNPLGHAGVAKVAQIHYAAHCTFITRPHYTYSRKDERLTGVQGAMRPHDRHGISWSTSDQARMSEDEEKRGCRRATVAQCAEREKQMVTSSFTSSAETKAPGDYMCTEEALLSEAERVSLQLFVARLGDGIVDDTSPFSSTERNRLLFLRWLNMHGKLPS